MDRRLKEIVDNFDKITPSIKCFKEKLQEIIKKSEDSKIIKEGINKACMSYSNNPKYERCLKRLKNPVPRKTYAKNTPKGANGAVVKKNDIIRYSIKYSNVKDQASSVIIMDHLSKGLKYQKGSAKVNGKKVQEISVTENSNGTVVVSEPCDPKGLFLQEISY